MVVSWSTLALGAILAGALALRLYHLGAPSLWLDEIGQAQVAKMAWPGILIGIQSHRAAAPLDYLITALVIRVSEYEWVLRLPPALWGLLAVYWVFRLGNRMGTPGAGLVAALLLATSPLHLRYSQELRFYSLFVLFALVATEALWRAYEMGGRKAWALYSLVLALGLYTHYYMALLIAFHSVWMVAQGFVDRSPTTAGKQRRSGWRGFAIAVAVAILLFLPWYLSFGLAQERGTSLFAAPDWQWPVIEAAIIRFSGGESRYWVAWLLLAGVGWLGLLRRHRAGAILLGCWVVASLPLALLIDRQSGYFFDVRQVLFALPAYLLLIGCGVEFLARLAGRAIARAAARASVLAQGLIFIALTGALLASTAPHTRAYFATDEREDWRAVGTMLSANLSVGDGVVLFNAGPSVAFYSPRARSYMQEAWTLADLERLYAMGQPVWVLTTPYLEQISDAGAIRVWLRDHPALVFDFDMGMNLHYMRAGHDIPSLWAALKNMNLGDRPALWAAKAQALRSIDRQASRTAYQRAADLTSDVILRAGYLAEAGDIAFFQQAPAEALALYEQALVAQPESHEIYDKEGFMLLELGRPEEAWAALQIALDKGGQDNYWPHRHAGDALQLLDRPAEALVHYQRALELLPEAHDLYYRIGLLHERLGQNEQARSSWQTYLALEPAGDWAEECRARLGQEQEP